MRCLPRCTLLTCAAAFLFVAGCGDATAPTDLEEAPVPDCQAPAVTTADITDIELHSAVSGGVVSADGGCEVTARGVVWCASSAPTTRNHKTNDGSGTGSFTSVMAELKSGVWYNVRAYATNHQGTAYGALRRFRTSEGTVTDIDGNEYQIVRIGNQWWMAENLRVTRYRNGDAIPTGLGAGEWEEADYGAFAVYEHAQIFGLSSDAEVAEAYGKLYNWFTVDDPRGICPEGWRVPATWEWNALGTYLAGSVGVQSAGLALKSARTEPDLHPRWAAGNDATNDTGWSGLPGGRRLWDGRFSGIGTHANFLLATERDELHSWSRILWYGDGGVHTNYSFKQNGNSIRCLRSADDS